MKKIIYFLNKIKKLIFLFLSFSLILFDFNGVGKIKVSRFFCYLCARCVVTADLLLLALRLRLFFFLSPFFLLFVGLSAVKDTMQKRARAKLLYNNKCKEKMYVLFTVYGSLTHSTAKRERGYNHTRYTIQSKR